MGGKCVWACSALGLVLLTGAPALAQSVSAPPAPLPLETYVAPPPAIPVAMAPRRPSEMRSLANQAQLGDVVAQYQLGITFRWGPHKDPGTAARWFEKAADQGFADAEFALGNMAYGDGDGDVHDYPSALNWFQKAANQGDAPAQDFLGHMYAKGLGVAQDDIQAYLWFDLATAAPHGHIWDGNFPDERSALVARMTAGQIAQARTLVLAWKQAPLTPGQQITATVPGTNAGRYDETLRILTPLAAGGNARAQVMLGELYSSGSGVAKDDVAAAAWLQKAADQGNPAGQFFLGSMYIAGTGVPKDYAAAAGWTRKAADQGLSEAQFGLGLLYSVGHGVPTDLTLTVYWLNKAAVQGEPNAQYYMGLMSMNGLGGLTKDPVQAYVWIKLATLYADDPQLVGEATDSLKTIGAHMSPDQISKAESVVKAWQPVFQIP